MPDLGVAMADFGHGVERVFEDAWRTRTDHEVHADITASVATGDPDGPGGVYVGLPQVTAEFTAWEGGTELGWLTPEDAMSLGRMLVAAGEAALAASERVRPSTKRQERESPDA